MSIRTNLVDYGHLRSTPSLRLTVQLGCFIALSTLIVFASLVGVVHRVSKGSGKFMRCGSPIQFNAAMVVQVLVGVYAACNVAVLVGYLTTKYSSSSFFTLQFVSPLLIYLALLVISHSSIVELVLPNHPLLSPFPAPPRSTIDIDPYGMAALVKRRKLRSKHRRINHLSSFAFLLLFVPPLIATIAFIRSWRRLLGSIEESERYLERVTTVLSRLSTLSLRRLRAEEIHKAHEVKDTVKLYSGFWIVVIGLNLIIYIPSTIYFLSVLFRRRSALQRAAIRLRGINERFESNWDDGASKAGSESSVVAKEKREELEKRLKRTRLAIHNTIFQSFVTLGLSIAYLSLSIYCIESFKAESESLFTYVLWSNWSTLPFFLLVSLVFAYHTFFSRLPIKKSHFSTLDSSTPINKSSIHRIDSPHQNLLDVTSRHFAPPSSRSYSSHFPSPSSTYPSRTPSLICSRYSPSYIPPPTPSQFNFEPLLRNNQNARHFNSYPPSRSSPLSTTTVDLERKKSQGTSVKSVQRKAVPTLNNDDDEGVEGGGEVESESASGHGSLWKEEMK